MMYSPVARLIKERLQEQKKSHSLEFLHSRKIEIAIRESKFDTGSFGHWSQMPSMKAQTVDSKKLFRMARKVTPPVKNQGGKKKPIGGAGIGY